jgi:hypothetical protein
VAEVAGLTLTVTIDGTPVGAVFLTSGTGNAAIYTGNTTTSNPNDVIIGYLAYTTAITGLTAGTGYTSIGVGSFSGVTATPFLEFKVVSSAGSYNPGVTWTGSSRPKGGTAAFKLQ